MITSVFTEEEVDKLKGYNTLVQKYFFIKRFDCPFELRKIKMLLDELVPYIQSLYKKYDVDETKYDLALKTQEFLPKVKECEQD